RHPTPPPTYTLSLHDALPISKRKRLRRDAGRTVAAQAVLAIEADAAPHAPRIIERRHLDAPRPHRDRALHGGADRPVRRPEMLVDRKSTRLNSSHRTISYAVF